MIIEPESPGDGAVRVDWIMGEGHCHPNDLDHGLIANSVFETIVRNCSLAARRMPKASLIGSFAEKYGNGPDRPSGRGATTGDA